MPVFDSGSVLSLDMKFYNEESEKSAYDFLKIIIIYVELARMHSARLDQRRC